MSYNIDSFYTVEGTEITRESLITDIIEYFRVLFENEETKITDFNEGSEIRNLIESFAVDLFELMYITHLSMKQAFVLYAQGNYLDLLGEEQRISRYPGVQSSGEIKISIPNSIATDVTLIKGSIILHETTGNEYIVNEDITIPAGQLNATGLVYAADVGVSQNCLANTLTLFDSTPPLEGMLVTNPEALDNGKDIEDDDKYRVRLLAREGADSFGSKSWYRSICLAIRDIHDVFIKMIDNVIVVKVNATTKPITSSKLVEVQSALTNEDNHVIGHVFNSIAPSYVPVTLRIDADTSTVVETSVMEQRIRTLFDGGIHEGIEYPGLNIGESVKRLDIATALTELTGVTSVSLEILQEGVYNRFSDIVVQEGEVLQLIAVNRV